MVGALAMLIVQYRLYKSFLKAKQTEQPNYQEDLHGFFIGEGGKWLGNAFTFRTPLPISDDSKNEQVREAIAKHNKAIGVYWVIIAALIATIVLMNFIDR